MQTAINEEFGFLDKSRLNGDFLEYFLKETYKHASGWSGSYQHFYNFVDGKCAFAELTIDLCVKFREYLLSAKMLDRPDKIISKNTASNYYRKFRGMLAITLRDKYIREDINKHLDRIEVKRSRIEFLTQRELLELSETPCDIPILKKASLFYCFSGLRYSDVKRLRWENIVPNLTGEGYNIRIRTKKTEAEATLPLSSDALVLCGDREQGEVFKGFNRTMTDAPLKRWIKASNLTKHITFHMANHNDFYYLLKNNVLQNNFQQQLTI